VNAPSEVGLTDQKHYPKIGDIAASIKKIVYDLGTLAAPFDVLSGDLIGFGSP
jgi:hypothetical protein